MDPRDALLGRVLAAADAYNQTAQQAADAYHAAEEAAVSAWNAAAAQATDAYNQAAEQAADAYNQAAEAAYSDLVAVTTAALAAWSSVADRAGQAYTTAVEAALAAWNQAEATARQHRDERAASAAQVYESVLARLDERANRAFQDYLNQLSNAGCGNGSGPSHTWQSPYRGDWLDHLANFSAGWGDTLSFSLTNIIRNALGINDGIHHNGTAYRAGQWTGVAHMTALGTALGIRAAGTKGAGREFSHWIPARWGGPRTIFNGNYVSVRTHALSDPWRYRFMSKAWKAQNPLPSRAWQQVVRIPNVYKGAGAGLGLGLGSVALNRATTE